MNASIGLSLSYEAIREMQARRLYDLKFGDALGGLTFEQYLNGTDAVEAVPQIPDFPEMHVRLFGRASVCLVDRRVVKKIGLKGYCLLTDIIYNGENNSFEPFEPFNSKQVKKEDLYWMIGQDGYRNRNRKPNDCRKNFLPFEIGMDVVEGASVFAHNPAVIEGHGLDLPGSVLRRQEDRTACLDQDVVSRRARLGCDWYNRGLPDFGSASRGV